MSVMTSCCAAPTVSQRNGVRQTGNSASMKCERTYELATEEWGETRDGLSIVMQAVLQLETL
eukprot:1104215-Rhodomonas_salina.3